jgi:hypothetical protein
LTCARLAQADAGIELAAEVRDWKLLEHAVDAKIGEQQAFVGWWDEHVRGKGGQPKVSDRETITCQDAEDRGGFSKLQVSRWRKSLDDTNKYREQQILAALRKADIGAGGLPAAASSTGPCGVTHNEAARLRLRPLRIVAGQSPER